MKSVAPTSEIYTPGHSLNALDFMVRRTVESHAAFARPLFRPGAHVLDCGCGPGSITLGIAACVGNGSATGVDMNQASLELARRQSAGRDLNVSFLQANVYELPFPDQSFDGVFSHALFEHLARPHEALGELRRVLKPRGFIALRSPDWGGFVLEPSHPEVLDAMAQYRNLQNSHGGNVHAGRKLTTWLREAGFQSPRPSAGYEVYASTALIADYLARQLAAKGHHEHAGCLRTWGRLPGAMFAQSWFEAVAWR